MKRAVFCLVLLLVSGCTVSMTSTERPTLSASPSASASEAPIGPSDREQEDAMKDVTIKSVERSKGLVQVNLRVKNHSTETSNYNVTVVAENKSGSIQYNSGGTYVAHIKPKQKRADDVILMGRIPKSAKIRIANVERWAS